MSLPEARILKGAYLLAQSCFNYGEKDLPLKELQRFRGIANGWSIVVSGLKNELRSADVFLGGIDGGAAVQPKLVQQEGSRARAEEERQSWEALWELFEDCRWLCANPGPRSLAETSESCYPRWSGWHYQDNKEAVRSSFPPMLLQLLSRPSIGPTGLRAERRLSS